MWKIIVSGICTIAFTWALVAYLKKGRSGAFRRGGLVPKTNEPRPPAPCGDDDTHYFWTEGEGWPCPRCARIRDDKRKDAETRKLAKCIAQELRRKP